MISGIVKNLVVVALVGMPFTFCSTPEPSPNVSWKFQTSGQVVGSCMLSGNRLFVGSTDGLMHALDKQSGKVLWQFDSRGAIKSTPAVTNDSLFFNNASGDVYALDAATGKEYWKVRLEGEKSVDIWDYYLSSPVVYANLLIVGSGNGFVYALDRHSGQEVWSCQTGGVVHAEPLIYKDKVYIGGFGGQLITLEAATGVLVWTFKTVGHRYFPKGEIQNGVSVFEDMLFFGSRDFNMYALDAETGTGLWTHVEAGSWVIATPAISTDSLLFVGTSDSHAFYGMNALDGTNKWKIPLNMRVYGKAAFYKENVLFGCFNGKLYAANKQTGDIAWVFQTEQSKKNWLALYDERGHFIPSMINYTDEKGQLAFEGTILGLGSFLASPVVDGDMIYIGSIDGFVYALTVQ